MPQIPQITMPEIFSKEGSVFNADSNTIEQTQSQPQTPSQTPTINNLEFINNANNASIKSDLPSDVSPSSVFVEQFDPAEVSKDLGPLQGNLVGVNFTTGDGNEVTKFYDMSPAGPVLVATTTITDETTTTAVLHCENGGSSESITDNETGIVTVKNFDAQHHLTEQIEDKGNRQKTITHFENGVATTIEVHNDAVTTIKDASSGRILSKTVDMGSGGIVTDTFTYGEDGSVVMNKFSGATLDSQQPTSQTYTDNAGNSYTVEYRQDANGQTFTSLQEFTDVNGDKRGLYVESRLSNVTDSFAHDLGYDSRSELLSSNKGSMRNGGFRVNDQLSAKDMAEIAMKGNTRTQNAAVGNAVEQARIDSENAAAEATRAELAAQAQHAEEVEAARIVANVNSSEVKTADAIFSDARKMDDNIGRAADTVLGWFGCTTIEDMTEKLGVEAKLAENLIKYAETGDMDNFKATYKEIFDRDFDAQTVMEYQEATTRYQMKRGYDDLRSHLTTRMQDITKFLDTRSPGPGLKTFAELNPNFEKEVMSGMQSMLKMSDAEFAETLEKYGGGLKGLRSLIGDIQKNVKSLSNELGSYDSINAEIKALRTGMFGEKDIVKDVEGFNKRQMATQIGANVLFDVALTVATGPILGATTAAISGVAKGAKMTTQAIRFVSTAQKLAEGSKVIQYGIKGGKMVATGVVVDAAKAEIRGTSRHSIDDIAANSAEKKVMSNVLAKAAQITTKQAGHVVGAASIISNYAGDIYNIATTSSTPRADLMASLKIDADTANYIIKQVRMELRA